MQNSTVEPAEALRTIAILTWWDGRTWDYKPGMLPEDTNWYFKSYQHMKTFKKLQMFEFIFYQFRCGGKGRRPTFYVLSEEDYPQPKLWYHLFQAVKATFNEFETSKDLCIWGHPFFLYGLFFTKVSIQNSWTQRVVNCFPRRRE